MRGNGGNVQDMWWVPSSADRHDGCASYTAAHIFLKPMLTTLLLKEGPLNPAVLCCMCGGGRVGLTVGAGKEVTEP